jgi:hypothetical protein
MFPEDFNPVLSGHTRFATSSKATLEGTHPHRWTPATTRRMYDFSIPRGQRHNVESSSPQVLKVENYITHNGDFDFYVVNGKTYDLDIIQKWLVITTGSPMPAAVDSCAVAGVVDLLRTQGCFGLSARYAVCFGLPTSKVEENLHNFPPYSDFEKIGDVFEEVVDEMLKTPSSSLESICDRQETRHSFVLRVLSKLEGFDEVILPIRRYIDAESGSSLQAFCIATIDAFFDNDLFMTTKMFLKNAKGSFGLCITSSLDAHRQICLAARGQTMSVAFYPSKHLVCYGSEQAAVKAALNAKYPGVNDVLGRSKQGDSDQNAVRLDLDHLGGEIVLLDWGQCKYKNSPVSKPNHHLVQHELINGSLLAVLYQESKVPAQDPELYQRLTQLSNNRLIKPIPEETKDLILTDLQDIPKICQSIQDEWHSVKAHSSLNRLTAYNFHVV